MSPECPTCGGDGVLLGRLGTLVYYRCRSCGSDYNVVGAKTDEEESD